MRKAVSMITTAALLAESAFAASCDRPEDTLAIQTAALQQELMVAAFMCHDVPAYNDFVLSHRAALQAADAALLAFFKAADLQGGFGAYNLYKTELANAASLRSLRDPYFCYRAKADFQAAAVRPLEQALAVVPFTVDTGSVRCTWAARPAAAIPATAAVNPTVNTPPRRVRHRTWLGRLVDWLFH